MNRFGTWLRGPAKASPLAHTQPLNAAEEAEFLEDAMAAATLIMDDDLEGADAHLLKGNSSFHQLGRGVTIFMRALLGFEQDVMKAASERLAEAEASSWADMKRAQRDNTGHQSKIYPPGSEFALCYSEAMLMSAVVAVLNENLTESIKGFYKLRKAFLTLDGIMTVEHRYMREKIPLDQSSNTSMALPAESQNVPGGFVDEPVESGSIPNSGNGSSARLDNDNESHQVHNISPSMPSGNDDSDLEFVDADEAHSGVQTPANYLGHVTSGQEVDNQLADLSLDKSTFMKSDHEVSADSATVVGKQSVDTAIDSSIFTNYIDIFIHSGTNLCYGLLLLIISMVPPAFSRLLSIIGFKGDRDRGIELLWQSTKVHNVNGAVAGLVLLGYYNGLLGFSDIVQAESLDLSESNFTGYPRAKCQALLADMRTRHPRSRLWRLEEARMLSGDRNLKDAINILTKNMDSPMKQIKALNIWELSLTSMWIHDYPLCVQSFLECIEYNSWSKSLYHFIAGSAELEIFRDLQQSDPTAAKLHKDKATELFETAPSLAGKKRLMAKQLPFEVYVVRKVQKWTERAKEWGVDFADAIGVSPLEEMIYLWNGSKRMNTSQLEESLEKLEWRRTAQPERHKLNLDEVAVHALLRSTILRNLRRFEESRQILKDNILKHNALEFKGQLQDDWSLPSAHYEMAVIAWFEREIPGADAKAKVADCEEWLTKVSNWESYVLDTRIGLKITTAKETLKIYKLQQEAPGQS